MAARHHRGERCRRSPAPIDTIALATFGRFAACAATRLHQNGTRCRRDRGILPCGRRWWESQSGPVANLARRSERAPHRGHRRTGLSREEMPGHRAESKRSLAGSGAFACALAPPTRLQRRRRVACGESSDRLTPDPRSRNMRSRRSPCSHRRQNGVPGTQL